VISTGSSAVQIFVSGVLRNFRIECNVVVWLADGLFQPLSVVRGQAQLFQRNRLAGRQNPHHHVLHAARRRDSSDAQLDVERAEFLELDLAVLGLAFFRDIQVAHDLQPGHQRFAKMRRNFDVGLQAAINAESDASFCFARQRLDVNVRGVLVMGVDDHLVDELHQFVVGGRRFE
jgi:hypothetical protein